MEQFKNRLMIQVDKYLLYDDQMKRKLEFSLQAVFNSPLPEAETTDTLIVRLITEIEGESAIEEDLK